MKTLNYDINRSKIEKGIIWFVTVAIMIAGLPIIRHILVFIIEKLYELFIQHGIVK